MNSLSKMMPSTDDINDDEEEIIIVFNSSAQRLCESFMKKTIETKIVAMKLKANWMKNNIIQVDATYEEVSTDAPLMKTLLKHLGQGKLYFFLIISFLIFS